MATMLMPSLRSVLSTDCNSPSSTAKSPSTTALSSLPANAAQVFTPISLPTSVFIIFAVDVHEINLRFVEKEMVVKRGDRKAVVQCDAHHGIHLVLEKHGVAHDHRAAHFPLGERRPRGQSHERRHRPTVRGNFH